MSVGRCEPGLCDRVDAPLVTAGLDPGNPCFSGRGGRIKSGNDGKASLSGMVRVAEISPRNVESHPRHAPSTPISFACRESSHLPNSNATMNGRVNGIHPEQYPPSPALSRNETLPYPRLSGTDNRKPIT